jgi:hypothetical protein
MAKHRHRIPESNIASLARTTTLDEHMEEEEEEPR